MHDAAIIMLASGLSSRFGSSNKLMAEFRGRPLCAHSAVLGSFLPKERRLAIVRDNQPRLAEVYQSNNWTVLHNTSPKRGQSSSLKIGIQAAQELGAEVAAICLADMPLIPEAHVEDMIHACRTYDAVMSLSNDILMPPASFRSILFEDLLSLQGDAGAKRVFLSSSNTQTIRLPSGAGTDIDTEAELARWNAPEPSDA